MRTPRALQPNRPLAPLTSLQLGGPARHFARVDRLEGLVELLQNAPRPVRILGGGSNLVVADAGVAGTVLKLETRGIRVTRDDQHAILTAAAGESFQALVELALEENLAGLECLTGIPGSVGAAPIQNVGAYGQELADTLEGVQVLMRGERQPRWLARHDCGFGYRDSVFKRSPGRYVVLAVRLRLSAGGAPTVRYDELSRALAARASTPSLRHVAEAVRQLRAEKSMLLRAGEPDARSAGSFFTNPVVSAARADAVAAAAVSLGRADLASAMPRFPQADGRVKLAAGWLIERAGFEKGFRRGPVGISSRHALALVHHGGGTTAQLLALAEEIRAGVRDCFGVTLEQEPVSWA